MVLFVILSIIAYMLITSKRRIYRLYGFITFVVCNIAFTLYGIHINDVPIYTRFGIFTLMAIYGIKNNYKKT